MALFLDSHVHKIDRKGRVSVPAQFRAALINQSYAGVIAFPSFRENCDAIEACGMDRMDQLSESLDSLDPFSNEQNDMATVIFGAAVQLPFDGEGRIMLPERLLSAAGITDCPNRERIALSTSRSPPKRPAHSGQRRRCSLTSNVLVCPSSESR